MHATKVCVLAATPAENARRRRLNNDVTDSGMFLKMTLGKIERGQPPPAAITHPVQSTRQGIHVSIRITLVIRHARTAVDALEAFWSWQGIGINKQIGIDL